MAAAESNADAADLMVELGDLHQQALGDSAGAEAAYWRALEQVPAHASAAAQLRELLGSAGRASELRGLIERMANAAPPGRGRGALLCELAQLRFADGDAPALVRAAYSAARSRPAAALAGMRELATRARASARSRSPSASSLEPPPARAAELLRDVASRPTLGDLARPRARRAG
jgi:hypothetical protein